MQVDLQFSYYGATASKHLDASVEKDLDEFYWAWRHGLRSPELTFFEANEQVGRPFINFHARMGEPGAQAFSISLFLSGITKDEWQRYVSWREALVEQYLADERVKKATCAV